MKNHLDVRRASMLREPRQFRWRIVFALLTLLALPAGARADRFVLKDGRILDGRMAKLSSLTEKVQTEPPEGAPDPRLIIMIDDDLRRTMVPRAQLIDAGRPDTDLSIERFTVRQVTMSKGGKAAQLGAFLAVGPWDEWGRRTLTMNFNGRPLDVIQGITQITPRWTKVESLQQAGVKSFMWDMRIATSSIAPDALRKILAHQIDPKKLDDRLKLVRLFLQSERYADAKQELEGVIGNFPDRNQDYAQTLRELKQFEARRTLNEINLRRKAGQFQLAGDWLATWHKNFDTEGVAGETLKSVEQALREHRADFDRLGETLKSLDADASALAADDPQLAHRLKPALAEIKAELSINSLDRMAAYRQFSDAGESASGEKLSLAVSGWLVGTNDALVKLPVTLSLFRTRDLVRDYLIEPVKANRDRLLVELESQEGATPELIAKLLAHMRPPLATPDADEERPGYFELEAAAVAGEPPVKYYVQLPPEYDPHRHYPTVVTLRGAATTTAQQIDWWAGRWSAARGDQAAIRLGQASRHGYIVVAPAWAHDEQGNYKFSAAEHAAVLNTLRDACRRFSIDTDRVFLTGHSMGGDAAWDIGLAHPDLWAGVIPIVARADAYISRIWENARHMNFYFVGGELDGDKPGRNAQELDRYMNRGYNMTLAEFEGRGHEDFSDEILRLFDWMNRNKRDFFPREFTCYNMRKWDNYFWWVDLDEFNPRSIAAPDKWPPPHGTRPAKTTAKVNANNTVNVTTHAGKTTLWLSPGIFDFKQKTTITVNGTKARLENGFVEPDMKVMLEDARTRGDRQHPFWAKVEDLGGRPKVAERSKK
jgi:predicted esterase